MKKLMGMVALLVTSSAYAEKVTGVGMSGYYVYQDSNGNKYVMHPTVPSVAYDLKGKQLDSVPSGYIKYATVKSDGTIVPFNENNSGFFSTLSWVVALALIAGGVWAFMKNKKRILMARQEIEAINRLKENLNNEAGNIFNKFHKNFRPSQIDYLEQNVAPGLLSTMRNSVAKESDFKDVNVINLKFDKVNVYPENGRYSASVNFNSVRTESNDGITKEIHSYEVWKLQMVDNKWIITSIEEVAPTTIRQIEVEKEKEKLAEKQIGGIDKFQL
jgi:hypothetical protein